MESTPGDREHGYDDELEQEAYENAAEAEDKPAAADAADEADDATEDDQ